MTVWWASDISVSADILIMEEDEYLFVTYDGVGVEIIGYEGESKKIEIPETLNGMYVTSIGEKAFSTLMLESVTVSSNVTSIGARAFVGCDDLQTITIPNSVTSIAGDAFEGCCNLTIECKSGSFAQEFAEQDGIVYILTDDLSFADISGIGGNKKYTGAFIKCPELNVKIAGRTLRKNVDYTVIYRNNKNVGNAEIVINGKGNYTGRITSGFKILRRDISRSLSVQGVRNRDYTGKLIRQNSMTVSSLGRRLVQNEDYTVKYYNNRNVGTARIVITGKGNYKGRYVVRFSINIKQGRTYTVSGMKYLVTDNARKGKGKVTLVGTVYPKSTN